MEQAETADRNFARALRRARTEAFLSQAELAAEMAAQGHDFHQTTIGKIERGDRRVSVGEAIALAEALGASLQDLITPDDSARLDNSVHGMIGARLALESAVLGFLDARDHLRDTIANMEPSQSERELADGWLEMSPIDIVHRFLETQRRSDPTADEMLSGVAPERLEAENWRWNHTMPEAAFNQFATLILAENG